MNSAWCAVLGVVGVCVVFFMPLAYELYVPERWKSRWEPRDVIWTGEE